MKYLIKNEYLIQLENDELKKRIKEKDDEIKRLRRELETKRFSNESIQKQDKGSGTR
jgi:FtsZ-binding cell division protein ZapB